MRTPYCRRVKAIKIPIKNRIILLEDVF